MKIDINQIKVENRIRKDYGDVEELANDIRENGLINPPVVTPGYVLVAGERRLRACQLLGFQEIEVNVMTVRDYEHQFKLEISENENRKEFTFSERVEWARRLETVERLKAQERMYEGGKGKEIFPEGGQVRDIVAEQAGFGSGKQYEKAKFVAENAVQEVIEKLDNEKYLVESINGKKVSVQLNKVISRFVFELDRRLEKLINHPKRIKKSDKIFREGYAECINDSVKLIRNYLADIGMYIPSEEEVIQPNYENISVEDLNEIWGLEVVEVARTPCLGR